MKIAKRCVNQSIIYSDFTVYTKINIVNGKVLQEVKGITRSEKVFFGLDFSHKQERSFCPHQKARLKELENYQKFFLVLLCIFFGLNF